MIERFPTLTARIELTKKPVEEVIENGLTFNAVFTTDNLDKHRDDIPFEGWSVEDYIKNPVVLFQHDYNMPIGHCSNIEIDHGRKEIRGTIHLLSFAESQDSNKIARLVNAGVLNGVSVGYFPRSAKRNGEGGATIIEKELNELSIVSIPINADAEIKRNKGLTTNALTSMKGAVIDYLLTRKNESLNPVQECTLKDGSQKGSMKGMKEEKDEYVKGSLEDVLLGVVGAISALSDKIDVLMPSTEKGLQEEGPAPEPEEEPKAEPEDHKEDPEEDKEEEISAEKGLVPESAGSQNYNSVLESLNKLREGLSGLKKD